MACLLILGKIWNEIERVPLRPKAVLVGALWPYTVLPASAALLEDVLRRARTHNVMLLLVGCPEDFLNSPYGRAAADNCAIRVLLKQDEASIGPIAEAFKLSDAEKRACLAFPQPSRKNPAEGIFVTEEARIPVRFEATCEEYELFTTR